MDIGFIETYYTQLQCIVLCCITYIYIQLNNIFFRFRLDIDVMKEYSWQQYNTIYNTVC